MANSRTFRSLLCNITMVKMTIKRMIKHRILRDTHQRESFGCYEEQIGFKYICLNLMTIMSTTTMTIIMSKLYLKITRVYLVLVSTQNIEGGKNSQQTNSTRHDTTTKTDRISRKYDPRHHINS